jgi:hypothetical protein
VSRRLPERRRHDRDTPRLAREEERPLVSPWVRWVVALLVACHGLVYLNAARGVLPVFDGWNGRSWLVGPALSTEALKRISVALWAVAGAGSIAAAAAFAFAFSAPGVWRPLAGAASAVGVASFLVLWDGRPKRLVAQGAIGLLLSLLVLVAALAWDCRFCSAFVP